MGGAAGGEFSTCTIFFFRPLLVPEFFFSGEPLCTNFFFRQILLFFVQWNLDSLSVFLCFLNYSTLTTDQRIQATLMKNLFENEHTVKKEEATTTWSGRLPCAFFPALRNSSPTAHHNDTILHSPKQPLCSALHSKMRLLRTNSSQETFVENIRILKLRLRARGYPNNLIEKTLSEVKFSDRQKALKDKTRVQKEILPFNL